MGFSRSGYVSDNRHFQPTGIVRTIQLSMALIALATLIRRLRQRLGFVSRRPITTAWDYIFSRRRPVWILVTMTDGSTVAGYFGPRSFASSDPRGRDLYIESVFVADDNGPWHEVPMNAGVWIAGTHILNIELRKFDDGEGPFAHQ